MYNSSASEAGSASYSSLSFERTYSVFDFVTVINVSLVTTESLPSALAILLALSYVKKLLIAMDVTLRRL